VGELPSLEKTTWVGKEVSNPVWRVARQFRHKFDHGSTTNEVRVPKLIASNAIHPERMAEISRWSPTGAPPVKKE